MLVELSVDNLALIASVRTRLEPGFTVLTGETGAGKSLLIDALQLVLGGRADADLVRSGAPRASVQAVFDLSRRPDLRERCEALGIGLEDGLLFIQREVLAEGRSQCRLGGKLSPVGTLRLIGTWLVDLHGQHDHQHLLDPDHHRGFLDEWIGAPARAARQAVALAFDDWNEAFERLEKLRLSEQERARRLDMLAFQIDEIERVSPLLGEIADAEARLSRLKYADRIAEGLSRSLGLLRREEGAALESLGEAEKLVTDLSRFDVALGELVLPLREALLLVEEATERLAQYEDALDREPGALEAVVARLDLLKGLVRKYGTEGGTDPLGPVLHYLDEARTEHMRLLDADAYRGDLELEEARTRSDFEAAVLALTALRQAQALVFAEEVRHHLADLNLERAAFEVRVAPRPADAEGGDAVEFFFSANAGEAVRPLAKIASGGELSRVMLAIRAASAGRAGVPTLVFDEVDTGLSGRAAAAMAEKIAQLAGHAQILAISHLPQIAGKADQHLRLDKHVEGDRTVTRLSELQLSDRVEEVARLLAGHQVTDGARANARELIGVA